MVRLSLVRHLAIAISLGFLPTVSVTEAQISNQTCDPIGRIIQGSSANFKRGRTVCSGDIISEPNGVQFLCFSTGSMIALSGQNVAVNQATCSRSASASNPSVRRCDRQGISRLLCFVPKGSEEQFQLIEPEAVSHNLRPTVAWEAVPGVSSYTVRVAGPDVEWQRTVSASTTNIAYPADAPRLTNGYAYEVIVVANQPETSLTASKVVNIQDDNQSRISLKLQ